MGKGLYTVKSGKPANPPTHRAAQIFYYFGPPKRKLLKDAYLEAFPMSSSSFFYRINNVDLTEEEEIFFESFSESHGGPKRPLIVA